MKKGNLEVCQNCIWWDGDGEGTQGVCNNDDIPVITGRYDDCDNILVIEIDWSKCFATS